MAGSPDFPAVTMKDSRESRLKEDVLLDAMEEAARYNEGF